MPENEMIEFFHEQIRLENHIVESITKSLKDVRNPVVKQVLQAIAFDSQKHAGIYNAAISVAKITPALTDKEYNDLKKIAEMHIADEERVLSALAKAMPKIRDEKIRLLLKSIVADENKHHELLETVMKLVVKKEAITEEDWWEILWKNVPFHGAPGG
ncbi:MAG: ferritin-like domain-containing protein [Candidatus Bathyarchaeota archaeon]|nr:MAG: ferritin-like domain-containing protein [Candidatus Bathyarchaeota archaeon]